MPDFDPSKVSPSPTGSGMPAPASSGSAAPDRAGQRAARKVVSLRGEPLPIHDPATCRPRGGDEDGELAGRILVIDDNPDVLALFHRIFADRPDPAANDLDALEAAVFGEGGPVRGRQPRLVVDLVQSGEAGHERLLEAWAERRPYAVAFVDMRMPGGWDGLETIEALWRVDPRLQVVICTAYSDHTWDAITTRLGRTDRLLILKKPFEKIEVLQTACALVDKWRMQREREVRLEELEQRVAERTLHLQAALREREAYERELHHRATHDPLTGLPNRRLLDDWVKGAIVRAGAARQRLAVLLLDLDRFKYINDSLGHRMGDDLLKAVAHRLLDTTLDKTDTVARLGGDEFVLIFSGLEHAEQTAQLADAVRAAMSRPFHVEGHVLHVNASIGVSVYPEDGEDGTTLLKHADAAMHGAKRGGGDSVRFFAREIGLDAHERVVLEGALRRALERHEFELHYQPQVDLRSGEVIGTEALIRWRRGAELIAPGRFIPLAEETGLITAIGEWVLGAACRQTRAWQEAGHTELAVAVNVSAHQLRRSNLPKTVRSVLAETGLAAPYLELELTESVLMEDSDAAARALDEIRALGVKLSLDDFGTGYSSLGYLKRFHFDSVKIDRSFIRDVTQNTGDASLTRAIMAIADSLELRTVAEGVETAGQLAFLATHRCDTIQGYFFSPPLPADEMSALLRVGKRLSTDGRAEAGQRTLLLVDDEPHILAALARVFRRDGYRILRTTSAREAFELLAMHPIGVIVCDGRMPELSGVEFFGQVKEMHPNTVRIMLSGYTEFNAVTDAVNRGAVYKFLAKPWDEDVLRASIAEAFRRHELLASEARSRVREGSDPRETEVG